MPIETTIFDHSKIIAGPVITRDDLPLVADTYYVGMPLKCLPIVTPDLVTGDGTAVVVSGKPYLTFIIEMTAALVAKIVVDGVDVITGIALTDNGTTLITFGGCTVAVTDGAAAFGVTDEFVISPGTHYSYNPLYPEAVYSGPDGRVMSANGVGGAFIAGQLDDAGIVDDSGDALTLSVNAKRYAQNFNIYFK
jgi:hypothetical protein